MNNYPTKKLKETFTPWNIAKFIAWFLVFAVSIYSLFQSKKSINVANESNKIADNALTYSQRPYLSVNPIKFNNGKFISVKEIEGGIEGKVRFEISNKGNSIAKNILLTPIILSSIEFVSVETKIAFVNKYECSTGNTALAPGELTILEIGWQIPVYNKEATLDLLHKFENNELSMPLDIEIFYDTNFSTVKGKVGKSLIFWPDKVATNYSILE